MYKIINEWDFVKSFDEMNIDENFSLEGRRALFGHLEQLEDETGDKIELDVIALCCEFSEYKDAKTAAYDYSGDEFIKEEEALEYLQERTQVLSFKGGIIISQF